MRNQWRERFSISPANASVGLWRKSASDAVSSGFGAVRATAGTKAFTANHICGEALANLAVASCANTKDHASKLTGLAELRCTIGGGLSAPDATTPKIAATKTMVGAGLRYALSGTQTTPPLSVGRSRLGLGQTFKSIASTTTARMRRKIAAGSRRRKTWRTAAIVAVALTASGCATTKYVAVGCLSQAQYDQLAAAKPGKIHSQLNGQADHDEKLIAGRLIRVEAWGDGELTILGGCITKDAPAFDAGR